MVSGPAARRSWTDSPLRQRLNCDADHMSSRRRPHHVAMRIDLDFDLMTVDGNLFHGHQLLGRPTVLVLLRYLG